MVEQYVEMYGLSTSNDQLEARNHMNIKIKEGWLIKTISITPDYGQYGAVYPQMYVLYEREIKNDNETIKNTD